jgi:hypothetical protein
MNVRGIDFVFVFMIFGLDFSNIFTDWYFRCFSFCIIVSSKYIAPRVGIELTNRNGARDYTGRCIPN